MTVHQDNGGFTLLEIMLAVLVLGMVVSMVSFSLSGSINVIDATMEQGELYYRAQVAMERICDDLTSALLNEHIEFIGDKDDNAGGQSILLSFATMAHIVFDLENGQAGMGVISYAVQPDRNNAQHLVLLRSDVLYRPQEENTKNEGEEAFLLCDRLRSVKFTFIDHDGEEQENWDTRVKEDDENTERRLPVAVVCRLEFWLDEEEEQTITFQTTVVLPVGLIQAEPEEDAGAA
ncbi:MAG: type II secretion system protein [Candidatus Electrothrix sp. AR4]|nr:type II secretion system protein [Candidatus Electrothrix sp. AR4]